MLLVKIGSHFLRGLMLSFSDNVETYKEDVRLWEKHVKAYKSINNIIDW